ncbi:MAG: serine/threonine-protein kinase [Myxococcota bacterium]
MAETMPYAGSDGPEPGDPATVADSGTEAAGFDATLPTAPSDGNLGDGSKVGRYAVLERVGAGGMGVVYRAHDPELRREVALKLLKAGRAVGPAAEKRRKRLLREARAMAQLSHPNVIPVYDVGEYGTGLYVAMEFVEGADARDWLKAVKPPWRRTLGVFRAAGRGLAAAHNAGLVHRDFKPANVLVGDDGRVRVLDFGLARAAVDEPEPEVAPEVLHDDTDSGHWSETLTADGTILGTPVYMAPEQYAGKTADARSDQYSYCIALYEALYGRLPFAVGSIKQQARAKYRGQLLEPPANSPVPRRLFEVLRRGLASKPKDRFASMPDLLRDLRTVHEDKPAPPVWRAWAAVGSVAGVTAAGLLVATLNQPASNGAAAATCGDASEVLAGSWDDATEQKLRKAFVDSGIVDAEARWAPVAERLDTHAMAWTRLHERACADKRAGDARGTALHAARTACLERHRVDLASFVAALEEPTTVVVQRAASAAHALPSLADCEDDALLLSAADEPRSELALDLNERIGRARALRTTGRPDAARREIDAVVEEADAGEHRRISARARIERASLDLGKGDAVAAERDLQAAYFDALASRHPRLAATAAVGLVDLLASRSRDADARVWADHARANIDGLSQGAALDAALTQALASRRPTEKDDDEG